MRAGNLPVTMKQMVMAGLKCPPEMGAQQMMAKAMPMPKAHPIWKTEPKPASASLKTKLAMDEVPATGDVPGPVVTAEPLPDADTTLDVDCPGAGL